MGTIVISTLLFIGLFVLCLLLADERPAKRHRMRGDVTKRGQSLAAPEMESLKRRVDSARQVGDHRTIH